MQPEAWTPIEEPIEFDCWSKGAEITHWAGAAVMTTVMAGTFVFCLQQKWPVLAAFLLVFLLPLWAGFRDRANRLGRTVRIDESGVSSTRNGSLEWSVPWQDYLGSSSIPGLESYHLVSTRSGPGHRLYLPQAVTTLTQLARAVLLQRSDPSTGRIKPPQPPPSLRTTFWTLSVSWVFGLASLILFPLTVRYWQAQIEKDYTLVGTQWWPMGVCVVVGLVAGYWAVRSSYWLRLHRRPELLNPERTVQTRPSAEFRRLVHRGRPPAVDLVEGRRYRYLPLDMGRGTYWFLCVGGAVCGLFLLFGTFVIFIPMTFTRSPQGFEPMNLLFGAFISLLGLGMGITFLMTAVFGAIALTLNDDEIQLERGNIKVSRRGKERTVANRVSKRLKIWISGGSCFGELEWFGEPGNRVPIDRRYLVPVEEETS